MLRATPTPLKGEMMPQSGVAVPEFIVAATDESIEV